jgi:hypothetical protein
MLKKKGFGDLNWINLAHVMGLFVRLFTAHPAKFQDIN